MFSLEGKIALVTGASQGIGEVIARQLAAQGALVVCASLRQHRSRPAAGGGRDPGRRRQGRLGDPGHAGRPRASGGPSPPPSSATAALHILVNNAGITKDKLMIQMKEDEFDLVLDVNLKGAWLATQAVAKTMMKQRWGRIINIASVVGQMGNAGQSNYATSKAGLIGLTKTVAREFASRNITCNAVAPGYIMTAMTDKLSDEVKAEFNRQIPLGRMGTPEDVAAAVAFLATDEASYITGQTLAVNGGMLMP